MEWRFGGEPVLAGVQVDGGGVLRSGDGETAKEQGERVVGLLVVLVRAKDRELRLYLGRATAAARWRPASRSGAAWQSDGSTARGEEERRELWRDAWEGHVKLEVEESGLVCNFRKFQGPNCENKDNF